MSSSLPFERRSLADRNRPQRFRDVWGQAWAVRYLSGLILRGPVERQLLFQGAHGSGKTSLARIHADALNCERVDPKDGSPCLTCNACTDPELNGLVEYDVAGLGGDDAQVEEWLAFYRSRSSIGPQRRVLFFDECHALSRKAQDRLLDIVEDPPPALSFSFATTAPWKLQPALRSRLNPVSVRSLNPSHSLKFLEHIAAKEGISFDREALVLLAGIKKGFPRDLLTGLEQVVGKGGHISVSSVREAFDVDDVDHLIEYVLALFNGAPQKQRDALLAWQLSDGEKANWILVLLTSIYYNQVIGVDTIIDPLIYADNRGRQVYEAFAHKARAVGREPAKAWLCMRQFWTAPVRTTDLQLALFEELVNDLLRADSRSMTAPVLDAPKEPLPARPPLAKNAIPATYASGGFLTYEDVREIVNRQSFFVQQHGVLMNVAFAVRPSHVRRMEGSAAGDAVKTFLADLQREFGKAPFASIAIIERDEGGIIGLVVAHISCLTESDGVVRLNEFCNTWTDGTGPCVMDMRRSRGRRDWSFHLEETLRLCAGYQQDSFSNDSEPLMELLGIPKRSRRHAALARFPVLFSELLGVDAIDTASAYKMRPLSAFDAKAWPWIRGRWELKEHAARKKIIRKRLSELEDLWPGTDQFSREERAQVIAAWPNNPEAREREWTGWWEGNINA